MSNTHLAYIVCFVERIVHGAILVVAFSQKFSGVQHPTGVTKPVYRGYSKNHKITRVTLFTSFS